ncbi:putative reverse transcriptase domain-containing protein [Tanacetum coccineum]
MSTQQDIYAAGFENRPPMLNKDNYVLWSSCLLCYVKCDPDHEVLVAKTFHENYQSDLYLVLQLRALAPYRFAPSEMKDAAYVRGYYRRFIKGFFEDRQTELPRLTQKKDTFFWGDKQEAAFQLLKQKLCSAPILALPEGSEDFIAYCDASKKGFGRCVNAKRGKGDCLTASLQLKIQQRRIIPTHDLNVEQ